ncbi:MAG: hypothetical protein ACRC2M_08560, partial [Planktothrix sp.]
NSVRKTCQTFLNSDFGKSQQANVLIYGDYSGKAHTANDERLFDIVFQEFKQAGLRFQDMVKPNPPISLRGDFINEILEKNYQEIELIIDEQCNETIKDLTSIKKAQDGTKHIPKEKDKKTGLSYEKFGHTSDAQDYFICEAFKTEFEEFTKPRKSGSPIIIPREGNARGF